MQSQPADEPFSIPEAEMAVWEALDQVMDPCHVLSGHGLSILDLGLVNRVAVLRDEVEVGLTLTEVGCTFAYRIVEQIEALKDRLEGVATVRTVIEPFPLWTPERLSQRALNHYAATKQDFFTQAPPAASRARTTLQGADA